MIPLIFQVTHELGKAKICLSKYNFIMLKTTLSPFDFWNFLTWVQNRCFLIILRWFPSIKWRMYKSKSLKSNFYADMQGYQTLLLLCLQSLCPMWFYRVELIPPPYVGINTFLMRESVNLLRQKETFIKNMIMSIKHLEKS